MLQQIVRSKRIPRELTARFFSQSKSVSVSAGTADRSLVETEVDGKIAILTLSRPPVNSLSLEM
jgi:hypothetical protein